MLLQYIVKYLIQFYFIHMNRQRELLSIPLFVTPSPSKKYQDHKLNIQCGAS